MSVASSSRTRSPKKGPRRANRGVTRARGPRLVEPSQAAPSSYGSLVRPATGFPDSMTVVLRYNEQVTLDATSTVSQTATFSANGCYDPNTSGTGHQPYCFDQYCPAIYNRYVVLRSRCAVTFASAGSSTLSSAFCTINARRENSSLATNDISSIVEDPTCLAHKIVATTSGDFRPVRTPWLDMAQYLGVQRKAYESSSQFGGTDAANPSSQVYYYVASGPSVPGQDTIQVQASVFIEYEVKFYSGDVPGSSLTEAEVSKLRALLPKDVPAPAVQPLEASQYLVVKRVPGAKMRV